MMDVHLIISGRVQGVFFRFSAKQVADSMGVTGWVRNLSDGTVEIQAQGSEEILQQFIEWCHRGPTSAHVERVDIEKKESDERFNTFESRY